MEINKHNLFSRAIEKSVESLLSEQRDKCREQYFKDEQHILKIREDAVKAFTETVCQWLEGSGERHYEIETIIREEEAAV